MSITLGMHQAAFANLCWIPYRKQALRALLFPILGFPLWKAGKCVAVGLEVARMNTKEAVPHCMLLNAAIAMGANEYSELLD